MTDHLQSAVDKRQASALRLECLKLACDNAKAAGGVFLEAERIVKDADRYWHFVKGDG